MLTPAVLLTGAVLCAASLPASASGFPLTVGNWWSYRATRGGGVNTDSSTVTLLVSDTLRLDLTRILADSVLSADDLPRAAGGQLHYVLEGGLVDILLTLRYQTCHDLTTRGPTSALLVSDYLPRREQRLPPGYLPEPLVPGMLWLSGVRRQADWIVLGDDWLLWDLSGTSRGSFSHVQVEGCHLAADIGQSLPDSAAIEVPAGTFSVSRVLEVDQVANIHDIWLGYWAYYSDDVGIVRLSQFDLVEAQVDGRHYPLPTNTPAATWGMVKDQQPGR